MISDLSFFNAAFAFGGIAGTIYAYYKFKDKL